MTSAGLCASLQIIDTSAGNLDVLGIETPQERVLAYIETTLGHTIQAIQVRPHGRPSVTLKRIRDVKTAVNPFTQQVERQIVDREVTYRFPGKNKDEAWRFGR
jgi:meiotic recombination protein SPO11